MPGYRRLGRETAARKSILKNLVTTLIVEGRVTTTETRAKEAARIAEQLITLAVREHNNFTTREILTSKAKLDDKGRKVLRTATSKNERKYDVVERELKKKTVQVDQPSRLAARRKIMAQMVETRNSEGKRINTVNHLFDTVAPRYRNRPGGYTRIVRIGPRRGDAAPMAILELVD
ncbi:MAG TPA: 50S ribosomal protein L17 [Bacillota bacterium]|jgi:large subunit ribosomal protein L17|nr:50S ribosomal protein L17 [Fastidiosipila sp.]HPX93271.1 50S ribosomal protein L17 [Bacillota bacterium]HQB80930.1 50S ribosomal protein L17 [Bacillota bacterium]